MCVWGAEGCIGVACVGCLVCVSVCLGWGVGVRGGWGVGAESRLDLATERHQRPLRKRVGAGVRGDGGEGGAVAADRTLVGNTSLGKELSRRS